MRAIHSPARHHLRHRLLVVAADHPSLDDALGRFLADLRSRRRSCDPTTTAADVLAVPDQGDIADAVAEPAEGGFRLAAVDDGRVVGLARVDEHGDLRVAVALDRRGEGIGTLLVGNAVDRARARGTTTRLDLRVPFRPVTDRPPHVTGS